LLAALSLVVAGSLTLAPAAFAGIFLPESNGSPNAHSIKVLYILIAILGLIIFIAVEGMIVYSMVKFRARRGATAAQIHGNTQLEIGWTVGAAVILVFITVVTFIMLPSIKNPKPSVIDENGQPVAMAGAQLASTDIPAVEGPKMKITVNGQQYVWRYSYPGKDNLLVYTDMVVPVGMTVLLDITADDVVHSWWIPKLGGKFDAVPGYTNKTWFQIPPSALKDGQKQVVFSGQCAELCGRNHANMYGRVIGMRMADYKKWYADKVQAVKDAKTKVAQQQKALQAEQTEGQ
jgi:cytochrome c oxidase subunit 2